MDENNINKGYLKTEVKQYKNNYFEKIKLPEKKKLNLYEDINEDFYKHIHVSGVKSHKKYFKWIFQKLHYLFVFENNILLLQI